MTPPDQLDTEDSPTEVEDDDAAEKTAFASYQEWIDKIERREKEFESGWWKTADKAVELYDGGTRTEDSDDQAYNILYSNTEVLLPSLYSATPKPDVRARYPGTELKAIPEITNRYLQSLSDPAVPGLESLDDAMGETTLSSLTAGMGFCRLRHYPERKNPIAIEAGHYRGLIWAKARKWAKLPWIAFRHELTSDELFATFDIPEEDRAKFKLDDDQDPSDEKVRDKPPLGTVVYELWVKKDRKIHFLCPDWEDLCLRTDEDTLKLEGFFPTPGIMLMTNQPGQVIPVPLYQYYRNQAQELNRVTVRLNKVLSAIRVRGAYNSLLGDDMQKLLADSELENALVPASEAGILAAQGGGFDRHIWLLPIEKLIVVATNLYQARQQIKQVIYELTGISDIIRGSSVASETATAQDLKNKWGTIRLRKMQAIVANYVRDLYRLSVDAGSSVLSPEQWKNITQLPIPTEQEQAVARQQMLYFQQQQQGQMQQYQQMAAMAQQAGQQPPPPPQPQQPPPALVAAMQSPTWEQYLAQIKDDANRTFLINIQTSSTIDLDTAADKADISEFMNSFGQALSGVATLAQVGPSGVEAGKAVLIAICQQYKFGLDMVPAIKAIQPQAPGAGDPAAQKAMEQEKQKLEQEKQRVEQDKQKLAEEQLKLKELLAQLKEAKVEVELARKELATDQKVAQISQSSDRKVFEAQQDAKLAKHQIQIEKTVSSAVTTGTKKAAGATKDGKAAPTPDQNIHIINTDLQPLVAAQEETQKAVLTLASAIVETSKKPKRLVKNPQDGSWTPEY